MCLYLGTYWYHLSNAVMFITCRPQPTLLSHTSRHTTTSGYYCYMYCFAMYLLNGWSDISKHYTTAVVSVLPSSLLPFGYYCGRRRLYQVPRFPPSFSNNVSQTTVHTWTVYTRRVDSTATTALFSVCRCIVFYAHCRLFASVSPVFGLYYDTVLQLSVLQHSSIWKRFRAIPDNVPLKIWIRFTIIIRIYIEHHEHFSKQVKHICSYILHPCTISAVH